MVVPHLPVAENTIIFEPDKRASEDERKLSARSYLALVHRHCSRGVGEAVVKKIEYRKSSEAPKHEFLLCYVADRNVPTRKAVIRIERYNSDQPSLNRENRAPLALPRVELLSLDIMRSSSPSSFGTAVDVFSISCRVNAKRSDATLSTLIFDDDSAFTADEAAMICKTASDCADEYNAVGHQCYWYAGVIYKIIQETYLGRFQEMLAVDNGLRGRGPHALRIYDSDGANRFIPSSSTSTELAQTHRKSWLEWMAKIEVQKKESEEKDKREERQKQELDKKDKQIESLTRQLERAQGN